MTSKLIPISAHNIGDHERLFRLLQMSPLEHIWYRPVEVMPSRTQWSGAVHEVDLDVRIATSDLDVAISWAREDRIEGLALVPSYKAMFNTTEADWVPVGDKKQWKPILGTRIIQITPGWHASEADCPLSIWSLRFTTDPDRNFAVALGEFGDEGHPTYHPDSLLVIFDEDTARSYSTLASIGSAWG